jgi:hypothetical protein
VASCIYAVWMRRFMNDWNVTASPEYDFGVEWNKLMEPGQMSSMISEWNMLSERMPRYVIVALIPRGWLDKHILLRPLCHCITFMRTAMQCIEWWLSADWIFVLNLWCILSLSWDTNTENICLSNNECHRGKAPNNIRSELRPYQRDRWTYKSDCILSITKWATQWNFTNMNQDWKSTLDVVA